MRKSIWVLRALSKSSSKSHEKLEFSQLEAKYINAKQLVDNFKVAYAKPVLEELVNQYSTIEEDRLSNELRDLIAKSKYLLACVKWRTTTCQQDDYEATQLLEEALNTKPDFENAEEAAKLKESITMENYFFEDFQPNIANKQ